MDRDKKLKLSKGMVWIGSITGIIGAISMNPGILLPAFAVLMLGTAGYLRYRSHPY